MQEVNLIFVAKQVEKRFLSFFFIADFHIILPRKLNVQRAVDCPAQAVIFQGRNDANERKLKVEINIQAVFAQEEIV